VQAINEVVTLFQPVANQDVSAPGNARVFIFEISMGTPAGLHVHYLMARGDGCLAALRV